MVNKIGIFARSLISLSLLSSLSLSAFNIQQLDGPITANYKKKIKVIEHTGKYNFEPHVAHLKNQDLEISSMKFFKKEFEASELRKLDIDNITDAMTDEEFITITQTQFLFPIKYQISFH